VKSTILAKGKKVYLRKPRPKDSKEYIEKANISRKFLYPWIDIKTDKKSFSKYLSKLNGNNKGFFICTNDDDFIAGVVNINEIVLGPFRSGYLGYYIFKSYEGKGYMTEGLKLVIDYAFSKLKLHRLEANIQPDNKDSIKLAKRLGFKKEGFSPRYLKIAGRWRDHERWAILREDWKRR
jgi:ribosomal-protein-alanine N-acetyltransferase